MSIIAKINNLKTNDYNQYVTIRKQLFEQFTEEFQNEQMEKYVMWPKTCSIVHRVWKTIYSF